METPTIQELAKKTFFRPSQREQTQRSIAQSESMLQQHDTLRGYGIDINVEEITRTLNLDRQTLVSNSPDNYDGGTKNKLNRVRQILEKEIQYDMPTLDDMERPTANNVDMHIAWEHSHKQDIAAWKSICRILDQGDPGPNFTNVERLRSNTPPTGDPRKYFKNFDNIQWDDDIGETFASSITDQEYMGFLELLNLKWAEANVCRELQWTIRQYRAAMERFRRSKYVTDVDAEILLQTEVVNGETESDDSEEVSNTVSSQNHPVPIMESDVWPIPQWRERGMNDVKVFMALCGINNIRFVRVCSVGGNNEWRQEEVNLITDALRKYDEDHAFLAKGE